MAEVAQAVIAVLGVVFGMELVVRWFRAMTEG